VLDHLTLAVSLLAFVVAVTAAVIAWSQLRLQQDAAGGRGIRFGVISSLVAVVNGVKTYHFEAIIELHGPGKRHEVALHLERGGRQLEPGRPGFNLLEDT